MSKTRPYILQSSVKSSLGIVIVMTKDTIFISYSQEISNHNDPIMIILIFIGSIGNVLGMKCKIPVSYI